MLIYTYPRFPPFLLYVWCKLGVTFARRCFRDATLLSSYGVLLQQRESKSRWYATAIRFDYVAHLYRPRIVEYRHPKCLATWNWWVQFDLPQTATTVGRRPGFVNIFSKKKQKTKKKKKKQKKKKNAYSSYTQNLAVVYQRLLLP